MAYQFKKEFEHIEFSTENGRRINKDNLTESDIKHLDKELVGKYLEEVKEVKSAKTEIK